MVWTASTIPYNHQYKYMACYRSRCLGLIRVYFHRWLSSNTLVLWLPSFCHRPIPCSNADWMNETWKYVLHNGVSVKIRTWYENFFQIDFPSTLGTVKIPLDYRTLSFYGRKKFVHRVHTRAHNEWSLGIYSWNWWWWCIIIKNDNEWHSEVWLDSFLVFIDI